MTLIPCLLAGITFAALGTWLTTRRGNTIRDILDAHNSNTEALRAEIAGKLKVSTTIPIVALYIVAAVVALGLPTYSLYAAVPHYEAWRVVGHIKDGGALQPVYVTMHPPHLPIDKDGTFDDEIPVKIDGDGQRVFPSITFIPNSQEYEPVVVHLHDEPASYGQRVEGHAIHIASGIEFHKTH